MTELEQHLQSIPHTLAMNPQAQALRSLLEAVVVARNSRDAIAALGLLQKVSVNNSSPVTTHLEFITHLACGFFLVTAYLHASCGTCLVNNAEQLLSLEIQ